MNPTLDAASAKLPMLGFGVVRHTRLRPVHNAFAYPGYFLLLPMRAMQDPTSPAARSPLARNRIAPLSFFDRDHGDGRGPEQGGALGWLDALLSRVFDLFLLIPTFFLVLLIIALFGSSVALIMVAIAVTSWPQSQSATSGAVVVTSNRPKRSPTRSGEPPASDGPPFG